MIGTRAVAALGGIALLSSAALGQTTAKPTAFDVASVKASQRAVGPDYNNQLTFSGAGLSARNATLKRLVAEAYGLQLNQVLGPNWLDQNEYDIEARAGRVVTREELNGMLQGLLVDRFHLQHHIGTRNLRVYELTADRAGPKVQPMKEGEEPTGGSGFHFHGTMRQLADLIAIQLTIPEATDPTVPARANGTPPVVLDKTALLGIYDFRVGVAIEPGTDGLTIWTRVLRDQLGLRLDGRRGDVPVLVVDIASRIPTEN